MASVLILLSNRVVDCLMECNSKVQDSAVALFDGTVTGSIFGSCPRNFTREIKILGLFCGTGLSVTDFVKLDQIGIRIQLPRHHVERKRSCQSQFDLYNHLFHLHPSTIIWNTESILLRLQPLIT